MKRYLLFAISVVFSLVIRSQEQAPKIMNIWVRGEVVCQTIFDDIDSITYIQLGNQPYQGEEFKPNIIEEKILPGVFSISPDKQIRFSSGNLQYNAVMGSHISAEGSVLQGIWRFATNQYDVVGNSVYGNVYENGIKCDNGKASATYDGWIDEFAFWTSGFDNTAEDPFAVRFHPWDRDTSAMNISKDGRKWSSYRGYGPNKEDVPFGPHRDSLDNLIGKYANYDWGVYNAISNGGNKAGLWRTLKNEEWMYLIHKRQNGGRGYAIVNNIKGLIILPDNWAESADMPTFIQFADTCSVNTYTVEEWQQLEQSGAVFLPCKREDRGEYNSIDNAGSLDIMPTIRETSGFVQDVPNETFIPNNVRLVQDIEQ